eukprot:SAG31_NODE_891_length_11186_cov_6.643366_5_plen_256_part_00
MRHAAYSTVRVLVRVAGRRYACMAADDAIMVENVAQRRLRHVASALPSSTGHGSSDPTSHVSNECRPLRSHSIRSDYLGGVQTAVHVLLPRNYDAAKRHRVLYILPVVCGEEDGVPAWGRPLDVANRHGFTDAYNAIVVMATFPSLSVRPNTLYVNHPSRADMRDEDYFCKDVVPLVDKLYSTVAKPCGRLLTGFCASGNGATWMLLRHLDMFGKSAVWETWLDLSHMHPPDIMPTCTLCRWAMKKTSSSIAPSV